MQRREKKEIFVLSGCGRKAGMIYNHVSFTDDPCRKIMKEA